MRQAQLAQEILIVVESVSVHADADIHASLTVVRHRRNAAAQTKIAARIMGDADAPGCQQVDVFRLGPHHVRQRQPVPQRSQTVKLCNKAVTPGAKGILPLVA